MEKELEKSICDTIDLFHKAFIAQYTYSKISEEKQKGNITQEQFNAFDEVASKHLAIINKEWLDEYIAINHHNLPQFSKDLRKIMHERYQNLPHYKFVRR